MSAQGQTTSSAAVVPTLIFPDPLGARRSLRPPALTLTSVVKVVMRSQQSVKEAQQYSGKNLSSFTMLEHCWKETNYHKCDENITTINVTKKQATDGRIIIPNINV